MYRITVRIEDVERRKRSVGLLHVIAALFLIVKAADYYRLLEFKNFMPIAPMVLIAAISMFYGFFRKKVDFSARFNSKLRLLQFTAFLILAIVFMNSGRTLDIVAVVIFAFMCLLLFFTEKKIFAGTDIVLDENGVTVPATFKDVLVPWKDLSEVIVREDFVTLFHVGQKYLQFQVMQDLSTLEIAKLNAFCREKIEGAASNRNHPESQ